MDNVFEPLSFPSPTTRKPPPQPPVFLPSSRTRIRIQPRQISSKGQTKRSLDGRSFLTVPNQQRRIPKSTINKNSLFHQILAQTLQMGKQAGLNYLSQQLKKKKLGEQMVVMDGQSMPVRVTQLIQVLVSQMDELLFQTSEISIEDKITIAEKNFNNVLNLMKNNCPMKFKGSPAKSLVQAVLLSARDDQSHFSQSKQALSVMSDVEQIKQDTIGVQPIEDKGSLLWVLGVDSIFNYHEKVPPIRRALITFEQSDHASTWNPAVLVKQKKKKKIKVVIRTRATPKYFLGKEVTQADAKFYKDLNDWRNEVVDTLRLYPMNIQNSKGNIEKRMKLSS